MTPLVFSDARFRTASLLLASGRIKLLSLDFFGGLFIRRVPKPADVFLRLGARLQEKGMLGPAQTPESFAALRLRVAQEKAAEGLVSLYASFPAGLLAATPALCAAEEIETEKELAFVPDEIESLLAFAKEQGLPVALRAVPPWSEAELRSFLAEKGPQSATNASLWTKRSGKGFLEMLADSFGAMPTDCLHLGLGPLADKHQTKEPSAAFIDLGQTGDSFARLLASEAPVDWGERAALFGSSLGDGGLSWLRLSAAFNSLPELSAEQQACATHAARALGPLVSGFAAWVAASLPQESVSFYAPTPEAAFLAELVALFRPDVRHEQKIPAGAVFLLGLDESDGAQKSLLAAGHKAEGFYLFSGEKSFALQKAGGIVHGFLTQNRNPFDLEKAWACQGSLLKAFLCESSPFSKEEVRAAQEGLRRFTQKLAEINKGADFRGSFWKKQAQAAARRLLLAPSEEEKSWTTGSFSPLLLPPEETRLRRRADAAIEESAAKGKLDYESWMQALFTPSVAARCFLCSYLTLRMNEIGRADLAAGARQRAWALGARSHDDFRLLWPLYRTERPTTETWGILKEAVLAAEEQKDVNYLLDVQNESHGQTYRGYYARDPLVPFQDPVLIRAFENVLGPLRPTLAPIAPLEGRPLRICCVMGGEATKKYSPVSDALFNTAEAFDRDRTEISFASVQFESVVRSVPDTDAWLKSLAPITRSIFYRQPGLPLGDAILRLAQEIAQEGFDALLFSSPTNARLALAALKPAPILGSFGFGWPELYSSPFLDFTAQWTNYPSLDCLCSSFRVPDSMPKDRFHIPLKPLPRSTIPVPENAVIVLSSGRTIKYYEPFYWRIVTTVLRQRPKTHFVFVGPTYDNMRDWLGPHVDDALLPNLHFLGYRRDHTEVLACADIILDTIPAGGGFNLTEAMNLGLPTVLCRNKVEDLFVPYDNRLLLPTGEILKEPSLNFERDDFDGICAAVIRLIDHPEERRAFSSLMKETAAKRKDAKKSADAIERLIREQLAAKIKRGF